MKKILSVLVAVVLVAALAVNVFAAEATVTGQFKCSFEANDYDSAIVVGSLSGDNIEIDHTWGMDFPDITPLIETVAPLSSVKHIDITITASDVTPDSKVSAVMCEIKKNTRDGDQLVDPTPSFVDGSVIASFDVPEDCTKVVLNPYAFSADAGEITFDLSLVLTGDFEAPAAAPETEAPAETAAEETAPAETAAEPAAEAPAAAPNTDLALAVIPAVIAFGAAVVSKKH